MNNMRLIMISSLVLIASAPADAQGRSVINTGHNLSARGAGNIRAVREEQVCEFCHSTHKALSIQPLWNRFMPVAAYTVYSSNSLDAKPGQPTGSSKLCLSCHDGTIALGSVASQNAIIQMAGGITTLPPGGSNLGTDLSDDHPISFKYDSSLVAKDPKLVDPSQLPEKLRLDHMGELQCTTCHDAHDNTFGHFLAIRDNNSSLCKSCHQISNTTINQHEDCYSCHKTHTAPSGPYLLTGDRIKSTCMNCHGGSRFVSKNMQSVFNRISSHDTNSKVDPPNPIPGHVTCADCHDSHTMVTGSAEAPNIHPSFGRINGINSSGSPVITANFEYEVCFKCHAEDNVFRRSWVPRQITQTNTRLEFAPSAISYHPVEAPGKNDDVPSLRPGWTTSSMVHCSDCHGSNTSEKAGGSGPDGVHGSDIAPLLLARYETNDYTPESANAYALCYKCHERDTGDGILRDRSFPSHQQHIVKIKAPCSACHDAHGISSAQGNRRKNTNLINFDTSIVFPDPKTGRMEFIDTGRFSGRCFLSCHGKAHSPIDY